MTKADLFSYAETEFEKYCPFDRCYVTNEEDVGYDSINEVFYAETDSDTPQFIRVVNPTIKCAFGDTDSDLFTISDTIELRIHECYGPDNIEPTILDGVLGDLQLEVIRNSATDHDTEPFIFRYTQEGVTNHYTLYSKISNPDYCPIQSCEIYQVYPASGTDFIFMDETNCQLKVKTDIESEITVFEVKF